MGKCSVRGLSSQQLQQLAALLDEQVEQNIGMGMIYAMVSAAQEWLRDLVSATSSAVKHLSILHFVHLLGTSGHMCSGLSRHDKHLPRLLTLLCMEPKHLGSVHVQIGAMLAGACRG